MTEVEGKISIWIQDGSFNHASDLYIQVLIDEDDVWRTDDKDGFSPNWDSTCVKHLKGAFEKVTIRLMDEDTFSRDDVIATKEFPICDLIDCDGIAGEQELFDADGNSVGTINVNLTFESGDVNMFELFGAMIHKSDD